MSGQIRPYQYGQTAELYALLSEAEKTGMTIRLLPESAGALLRELEHLRGENRDLANRLTQAWMEARSD